MGATVGYVGSTGLATGPHLHFEMLVGGAQRDPGATLRKSGPALLTNRERGALTALRTRLLGRFAAAPAHVALAE